MNSESEEIKTLYKRPLEDKEMEYMNQKFTKINHFQNKTKTRVERNNTNLGESTNNNQFQSFGILRYVCVCV